MRQGRWLLAALALVLLGACWTGEAFYTPADARPAIPAGDYATTSLTPQDTGRVRVSHLADGMTLITPIGQDGAPDPGDAVQLGFAPLAGESGKFVAWLAEVDSHNLVSGVVPYGLLVQGADGAFRLAVPGCELTQEIARAAGAGITQDGETTSCRFTSRASLEAALRRLNADGDQVVVLTPWRG